MLVFPAIALAVIATLPQGTAAISDLGGVNLVDAVSPNLPSIPVAPRPHHDPLQGVSNLLNYFNPITTIGDGDDDDDQHWGDSIRDDPQDLHRIYFQNVDGLRNDYDTKALSVSTMAQLKVGTFCWADPCLDFSQTSVRKSLQTPINQHFTSARCAFSSCALPATRLAGTTGYQPGGTFMASTGRWATRSTGKPLEDPSGMGRWSGLCYLGKRGKRLAIITAYRSPRGGPSGGFGFHDQQFSMLLANGVANPNVRRQFINDMILFVNKLQLDGYEILLSLDANETTGEDRSQGLAHMIAECSLSDLHLLGPSDPPATYKYGDERRIDYMLGSSAVADAVSRAGYTSYDGGIFSKHRGLFVDLDFTQLMGSVDPITPAKARGLSSEDQPAVDRYLAAFKQYAGDHNLWERVSDLVTVAPTMTPSQCKIAFDAIDRDVTRGMLHAERQAKRPSGKYAWSPKLREAGLLARYWNLRLKEVEKTRCLRVPITALVLKLKSLNIVLIDDLGSDAPLLKEKWQESAANLRHVRETANEHRAVHLIATLTHYHNLTFTDDQDSEKEENRNKIARIQRLINIEKMRKPFRAINAFMTVSMNGGLAKLFVPSSVKNHVLAARFCDADGQVSPAQLIAMAQFDKTSVEYETILDCAEIEEELTRYNRNWFRQAKDTPFGQGELYDLVGYDGLTPQATAIVDGDNLDTFGIQMKRELRVFMEECKRPDSVDPISTIITSEDFVSNVKAWKESTSTSPSGRHLGHYRTAILDTEVTHLHTQLLNLPITYGFAPDRWTHSVTPLIEKDEGRPYLTRLRVIHLFEADYNLFLKIIFGRRMVKNAEKAEALNDQQHGSRPRRMTTDALFLARLEKDLIRQTKANSAHMDNDATGCYDRIITALGMIACRRLGMPEAAIRCQAETLKFMRYAVKHIYGTSATEYTGTDEEPLFGTGQGSGASPAIWLGLVVILLNSLDRMSAEDNIPSLSFADPWEEISSSWRVGAFVDDTNQGVLDATGTLSIPDIVEKMRCAGQFWESLLHISGGSLNLSKCSWTLQYWIWVHGRPALMPISADDPPLRMTSGENTEPHIIRQQSNTAALKGLGVHMNFLGTFEHHAKTMRQKFDGIARRLCQSALTPTLVRSFYNTFYLPSVRYSLPVTSMTTVELHRIQSLMTSTTLNRLGYNRHYPHAVAFAPTSVFGVGLIDLRIEQGLLQTQALLDYVGTGHRIGEVMLISLRHLQVEAGVSFDLLQSPSTAVPHATECWMMSLRRFCAQHAVTLRVKRNRVPGPVRVDDTLLMDKALTLGFKKQQLIDVNLVRTYLQVTTVSDISTADGTMIHAMSWRGRRIPDRQSRLIFARQEPPTSQQRGLWRRLLRSLLQSSATSSLPLLLTPLGEWTGESHMVWGAMLWETKLYRLASSTHGTPADDTAIGVHLPQHIELSDGSQSTMVIYDSEPDRFVSTMPVHATPADTSGCNIFTVTSASSTHPIPLVPAATFAEWVQRLPPAEKRLIDTHYFEVCDAEQTLVQYLQVECTLLIGTDGGKRHSSGAFSWLICAPDQSTLVLNEGPVDGWSRCQSSLRSEEAAIASLATYLDELAAFHDIDIHCNLQLYVDSKGAISNVTLIRDRIPKRRFPDNADLLAVLRRSHHVTARFCLTHVKSHQDEKEDFDKLPFSAQLNVLADRQATKQLKSQEESEPARTQTNPLPTRALPIEVFYKGQAISSHYIARLRDAITTDGHRDYLAAKYKWPQSTLDRIAWEAMSKCARTKDLPLPSTRSKLVHNWLNLGAQRATMSGNAEPAPAERWCPYCKDPEDFHHLMTCCDSRANKFRYDAMIILNKTLSGGGPGPRALSRAIKQWVLTPLDPLSIAAMTLAQQPLVDRAIASQTEIGWLHVFRGFVSLDWGDFYSGEDTTPLDSRKSEADKSLSRVIRAVQDYTLAIWTSRNAVLHEATNSTGADIVNADLNQAVVRLYALQPTLSPILQSYFHLSLEDRLRRPPRQRKRWLRLTQLATSHSSSNGTRQQLVTTYYPHAPQAPEYNPPTPAPAPAEAPVNVPPSVPTTLHQLSIASFFSLPEIELN